MYTVILVDDQPLCLKGMETGFDWGKYGFEIVYKTTNQEVALEMIKELNPDVVCTDMRMPQISGIELIKAARAMNAKAEFIIVSGYEDFKEACEAIRYNAFRYCLKPLDKSNTDSILQELKEVLDDKHRQKERQEEALRSVQQTGIQQTTTEDVRNYKFKKLLLYIEKHYAETMSLAELADKFEINASFASRLFSQYFGMGYSQYLTNLRLQKAAELLQTTRIPLQTVAYTVGFNDYAYFSRTFKRYYGESPYDYRCREKK